MFTYKLNQVTQPIVFLMISIIDHITPLVGASPTVLLSKNGASFAAAAGAVVEIGNGWYRVVPNILDFDTLGPLILHAEDPAGDPTDATYQVNTGLVDLTSGQSISIVGDIVGNVTGSVGSVTAPVTLEAGQVLDGNITGDIIGNVQGSVGSVIAPVTCRNQNKKRCC